MVGVCPSLSPRACSNTCPLSHQYHPAILFSVNSFSFPSGSFLVSWLFTSVGQRIGASASESVLPMNIQDWFPLGLTDVILQSKGFSRVFSNTTVKSISSLALNLLCGPTLTILHHVLFLACSIFSCMWDLVPPTRYWTQATCTGSTES